MEILSSLPEGDQVGFDVEPREFSAHLNFLMRQKSTWLWNQLPLSKDRFNFHDADYPFDSLLSLKAGIQHC